MSNAISRLRAQVRSYGAATIDAAEFNRLQAEWITRTANQEAQDRIAALEAENAELRAERDAWKKAAEKQYGRLRIALYGTSESTYPTEGALDAWAAKNYPALQKRLI